MFNVFVLLLQYLDMSNCNLKFIVGRVSRIAHRRRCL